MFDAISIETSTICLLWVQLYFGSIVNVLVIVGRDLKLGWALVSKAENSLLNVAFH